MTFWNHEKPAAKPPTNGQFLLYILAGLVQMTLSVFSIGFFHKLSEINCHYDGWIVLGNIAFIGSLDYVFQTQLVRSIVKVIIE